MSVVEVARGRVVESRHLVHIVVSDGDGNTVASLGNETSLTYYRSAAKPLQALPLVEEGIADRLSLTPDELALSCASHEGEREHVEGARSILRKARVDEAALACGAHAPFSTVAARALSDAGEEPCRIHNNCSGKHASMLALAVGMGWPTDGYHLPDHPVQKRMLAEIVRWTGLDPSDIPTGVDGCGVVCFAVPLDVMAASFARFAAATATNEAVLKVVTAMTEYPFMVGGTGRACTEVMRAARGSVFVKLGAEGVYGGGIPERGLGFAIKVADGGRRAVEVALVHTLAQLGALDARQVEQLKAFANPPVLNTRNEVVGEIRAAFRLDWASPVGSAAAATRSAS